jgi:hypothetical protein
MCSEFKCFSSCWVSVALHAIASRFYHRRGLKTGERQLGGWDASREVQVLPHVILLARERTPRFYKIVCKRLKAENLIFALWEKSEQRVRKRLKIGR